MKTRIKWIAAFLFLQYSSSFSQNFQEIQNLYSANMEPYGYFGNSVCISGDYAIVGAPYEDTDVNGYNPVSGAGAAYIYKRQASTGNWQRAQKLTNAYRSEGDYFGWSVSISGRYAIVGAYYDDLSWVGSASVFECDANGNWNYVQKLVASDWSTGDCFGNSVCICGEYAIVGAYYKSHDDPSRTRSGAAYIFERDASGRWIEKQKLEASYFDRYDYFGCTVSLSGNYAIIGANGKNVSYKSRAGAAYLFHRNNDGIWSEVQQLTAPEVAYDDQFGSSVCISGNYAIVGAYHEDEDASENNTIENAGSAYVYELKNGSLEMMQKIVAGDRAAVDSFGCSVSISGNYAVVGAYAENEDNNGKNTLNNAGSAYIYQLDAAGNWNEVQKIVANDRQAFDLFGNSVSISGDQVIVGACRKQLSASPVGSAYIFRGCVASSIDDPDNIILNGDFGSCNLDPWWLWVDNNAGAFADATIQNGVCLIHNIQTSDYPEFWHIQLIQPFSEEQKARLEPYAMYSLSFDASAESVNRYTHVFFGQNEDPWLTQVNENIWLNKEKQTFTFDFTLLEVYSAMRLSLEFGEWDSNVRIDNVRLVKTGYDRDGDRIEDNIDNCPDIENPVQDDADGDNIGNKCDNCLFDPNPYQEDSDGDNIGNACDNCPNTPNASQQDSNGNGIGDVCETSTTPVFENQNETVFRIFPNPVSGILTIESIEGTSVRLYDQTGSLIWNKILKDNETSIDVSNLPSGLYILAVSNGIHSSVQKVIVQ
ncbi:MAG: T9SS type A sorting domain-containing protein [Bacteroidales bacterium]|nr:T9SS type A sorting domain-containing protein [Bacteroidales bacterium]